MALIQTGNGVAQISGKVAGNVFSRNRGGAYVRNRVKPLNPRSNSQANVRARLGVNATGWRVLTAAQRLNWEGWAATHPILNRLGAQVILTGSQAYVQINNARVANGDATTASTVPGEPVFTPDIIDVNTALIIDISTPTVIATLGAGAVAGQILNIYATPFVSPGIANAQPLMRLIASYTLVAGDITLGTVDFQTQWAAKFGAFTGNEGRSIVMRITEYDEGQYSVPVQISGVAVA